MKPERYQVIYNWFKERPYAYNALCSATKGLPMLVAFAYGWLLFWQVVFCKAGGHMLVRLIGVPAVTLVLGSLVRKLYNAPRPYEKGIQPLMEKQTKGQSCPSRHALSAGVIAAVWFMVCPPVGVGVLLLAVGVCVTRVLAGVHSIWDVTAGLLFGLCFGLTGMVL